MEQPKHLAGRKIRAWREQQNMTAAALGELIDPDRVVAQHTVYNWEERGKVARPRVQRRLADMGICKADDWLRPAPELAPEPGTVPMAAGLD